jgi:hypothetical protein
MTAMTHGRSGRSQRRSGQQVLREEPYAWSGLLQAVDTG